MTLDRRTFLSRALRSGFAWSVLGGAAVAGVVRASGYAIDERRAACLKALSPWQLAVIDAVADRICAPDVPAEAPFAPPTPREVDVGGFVDEFVAASDPPMRRDLLAAIACVEHLVPLAYGELHRFTALAPERQDRVLERMAASSNDLVRGCFAGLKAVVMMGYWRDPRTWGVLRYDGPQVGRPPGGWTQLRYKGDP